MPHSRIRHACSSARATHSTFLTLLPAATAPKPPQAVTDAAHVETSDIPKRLRDSKVIVSLSREATGLLLRFLQSSHCGLITSVLNEHVVLKVRARRMAPFRDLQTTPPSSHQPALR